jgi:hypothetical protein
MNHRFAVWLLFSAFLMGSQTGIGQTTSAMPSQGPSSDHEVYVPGELFVKTSPDLSEAEIISLVQAQGGSIVDKNSKLGF